MSQINPYIGSVLQSTVVQRDQATQRDSTIRRAQTVAKDIAAADDRLEHQVESSEEIAPLHDEHDSPEQNRNPPRRRPRHERDAGADEPPHVDVTA